MSDAQVKAWVGHLSMALMFEGSRSEGMYPVLRTDDGRRLRVHIRGNRQSSDLLLSELMNQRVSLQGTADDLRGHWRLIVDPAHPGVILPSPEAPNTPTSTDCKDRP